MLDLAHLLHVLSFVLGIIAMLAVYNNRTVINRRYLWSYIIVLLCINLVSAAHSYESFIKIKASLGAGGIDLFLHLGVMTIFLSVVRISLAYHFVLFCWRLSGGTWNPRYRALFMVLLWAMAGSQALALALPGYLSVSWLPMSMVICHGLVFVAFLLGAFKIMLFSRSIEQNRVSRWLRAFFWFWTAFNLLIFANRVAGYAYLVDLNTQLVNFGIVTLLMNTLHVVFVSRFFGEYRANVLEKSRSHEQLFQEYGITRREQDITRLICEGKTNKEIAKTLFIAPNTVRDHTSNIYRKAKVKNRTQLASLFTSST